MRKFHEQPRENSKGKPAKGNRRGAGPDLRRARGRARCELEERVCGAHRKPQPGFLARAPIAAESGCDGSVKFLKRKRQVMLGK